MSVVHERQSRQLCAIHAVNNLLQLHFSRDETNKSNEQGNTSSQHQCMYQCGPFIVQRSCKLVTKLEMDRIADDLTLVERNLLQENTFDNNTRNDDNNSAGGRETPVDVVGGASLRSQHNELSLKDKLVSNHRTMYLGCYSFECLELCLKNRGVALEWYRSSDDDSSKQDSAAELQRSARPNQVVCGFIINLADESPTFWSAFQYLPLVGRLVHVGRHWFAVTRLRRQINGSEREASESAPSNAKEGWLLIDSDREDIVALCDTELVEYLASLRARGGQTFRATIET